MKASTEEFLYVLLWAADSTLRPTWRNLDDTFESWAYRNGLGRRLEILERQKFLERQPTSDMSRVYRLTAEGRRTALGGCDPSDRWERKWDGYWRMVLFDLPVKASALRVSMRRFLLRHGFGYLQQSVWITPDSLKEIHRQLRKMPTNVESLTLFEGQPCGGESDAAIVRGAWDFPAINALYARHQAIVNECPEAPSPRMPPGPKFWAWARREREAWKAALSKDPLLPRVLLPAEYLGRRSWEARKDLFNRFQREFRP
jgi:phenylacetic acid degradation operon negative regulatory protein